MPILKCKSLLTTVNAAFTFSCNIYLAAETVQVIEHNRYLEMTGTYSCIGNSYITGTSFLYGFFQLGKSHQDTILKQM